MDTTFFNGKTILLTGATGDLGAALARKLSGSAATLILTSRSAERLAELAASLPWSCQVIQLTADLSQPGEAARLVADALAAAGRVDLLINNAGLGYFALMEEAEEAKIRYLFEVNTFSPMILIQLLTPHMARRGGGRIVNIVSSAGRVPIPTVGVYGGSKSALAVMTNTMRLELEPKNIDIINIYPGTINDSFEQNAMRENDRPGLCPTADCGEPGDLTAEQILLAAAGEPGEVWLEKTGKWMALAAIAWPTLVDNQLRHLRNRAVSETETSKPPALRRWRLWQLESTLACNLNCIMCPWVESRKQSKNRGHMAEEVWRALAPHLGNVKSVDFTGGGEPLLQPRLLDWVAEAKDYGCHVGFLTNGLLLDQKVSERLLNTGIDWLGFSIDGADRQTYEFIRRGSDFDRLCANIRYLASRRLNGRPFIMVNFVIMRNNHHQLEPIIRLAAELGIDQVNFKQCDVIRGEHGKGFGLFGNAESPEIRQLQKALSAARRLARKLDIKTTAFSFVPEELPVCDQDPRDSLFIRHDGSVAPCINLAVGGPSIFLGEEMVFPQVSYGRLPDQQLPEIWESDTCRFYRSSFSARVKAHDGALERADIGRDLLKLQQALQAAVDAMPDAPRGCRKCHYLYDI